MGKRSEFMVDAVAWFDYGILGIILLSALISFIRGFLREVFSLVTWIAAFWVAITFNEELTARLATHIAQTELRVAVSFGILFMGTLLVGGIINFLLGSLMQRAGLSGTDRLLGVLFGLGRGILFVALLLALASLSSLPKQLWWQQSQLVPYFKPLQEWIVQFIPQVNAETTAELRIPTKQSSTMSNS